MNIFNGPNHDFRSSVPLRQLSAVLVASFLICAHRSLALVPPPTNTNLLDSWSFEDTNYWTSDLDRGPVSFTNLTATWLGDGTALVLDSAAPAWLQYNVFESDGATNLAVAHGSVVFWFAPNWSSTNDAGGGLGPQEWGRLLEAGAYTTNSSCGWWSLYVDPAGANVYFSAQTNDGSSNTYTLSAPIDWTTNRWHFIALTYQSTNIALYLDGQLATNDPSGLSIWPSTAVLTNGFFIGSSSNGVSQAHGWFDDVATYDVPLNAGTISGIFAVQNGAYYANPANQANWLIASAGSTPTNTPAFDAVSGPGNLHFVGTASSCVYGTNAYDVWITNAIVTKAANGTRDITFSIEGGAAGFAYDVFANSVLGLVLSNTPPFAWMGQGNSCDTFTLTNLPNSACYLVLGTPLDDSGYGLTDAYERLVLHMNPDGSQTDGYGVPYAWYAQHGFDPLTPGLGGEDPDQDGLLNYQEYLYGTNPQISEGFAIWVGTPNGTTGIP